MRDDRFLPRLSHFCGDRDEPLLEKTIGAAFDETVDRFADRPALVVRHQRVRLTYSQLKRQVDDFAVGLLSHNLSPGDRIGIWAPSCAEWTIAQYAAAKIGLILVNLNPAYRTNEIEYAINKAGCSALVLADEFKGSRYIEMLQVLAPELSRHAPGSLRAARLSTLRLVIRIGEGRVDGTVLFQDILTAGAGGSQSALAGVGRKLKCDDPINIQFTSGTTGAPKGATLSHKNLLNAAYFTARLCGISERDAICVPLPLYHVFGMTTGNILGMLSGSKVVHPSDAFDADAVLSAVEEERCSMLYGVPTMFIAELSTPGFAGRDLSSLRGGIIAGASVPIELMRRVMTDMHMPEVVIGYGMTETSSTITITSPTDAVERRVSTVGKVVPHVEVKAVDPSGQVVAVGTAGEICVRGYSVMLGYWDDAARTAEAVDPKGWIKTGDLGVFDEEGYCRIVGRIKELIIRGGENISPVEIEGFLHQHPAIESVQVVGVPDQKYGEELCACIKVKSGESLSEEEVRAFCRGQIAHFKIPRHVRFMDSFPMTASGKVQKFRLAQESLEALGLARGGQASD